jgi:hypothetical protein
MEGGWFYRVSGVVWEPCIFLNECGSSQINRKGKEFRKLLCMWWGLKRRSPLEHEPCCTCLQMPRGMDEEGRPGPSSGEHGYQAGMEAGDATIQPRI